MINLEVDCAVGLYISPEQICTCSLAFSRIVLIALLLLSKHAKNMKGKSYNAPPPIKEKYSAKKHKSSRSQIDAIFCQQIIK